MKSRKKNLGATRTSFTYIRVDNKSYRMTNDLLQILNEPYPSLHGLGLNYSKCNMEYPIMPIVKVVLRHFHQSRYRSGPLWFFCGEGLYPFWLFAPCERGGHDNLRGSDRLSVTPYVHGRTELYFCSSLPCLSLFCFFDRPV
jgi:hypothetical protein